MHGRESADMAKSKKKTVSRSRVAALLVILVLGCHNVGMGNHLTLVLGYLLLYGYDVEAVAAKVRRWTPRSSRPKSRMTCCAPTWSTRETRTLSRVWPGTTWAWPPTASAFFTT